MGFLLTKKMATNKPFRTLTFGGLRWRKSWRDLWLQKSRTLMVILSTAVGIFAFGLISGAQYTLITEFPISYQSIHPASGIIHAEPFDEGVIEAVRRMPEVAVAEGRLNSTLRYVDGDGEWHDLQLLVLETYETSEVDLVRPIVGAWPPPENQILIERNSISLMGKAVGESVLIETSAGLQRTMPIAGLTHDLNQAPAQVTGVPYGYIVQETLDWLGMPPVFNELRFIVAEQADDRAHIHAVANEIGEKVAQNGRFVLWREVTEPGEHFAQQFLPTITIILGILGGLALILSGFLVINVIMAILAQQRRQIGIMKTVGARTLAITAIYLRMILLFGIAALMLAMPLGIIGASLFSRFIAGQLNFDVERVQIAPAVLLLEVGVGLLTPILVSLIPIIGSTRMTVREAIQDFGLKGSGGDLSRPERVIIKVQERLGMKRPLRLSLRNTFRRKGRLARTLITLILGGAIFMSVLSLRSSLFNTLEITLANQGYDVLLQLNHPYRMRQIEAALDEVKGIAAIEYWNTQQGVPLRSDGTEGGRVILYGLPADTDLFVPDMVAGRWLNTADTNSIVVPISMLEDEPDVQLGSTLEIR